MALFPKDPAMQKAGQLEYPIRLQIQRMMMPTQLRGEAESLVLMKLMGLAGVWVGGNCFHELMGSSESFALRDGGKLETDPR